MDEALEPFQIALHHVELKLRLTDRVSLPRIDDHRDRNVAPLQRRVELVALRDRHALVVLAMLDESGSGERLDAENRGTILPQLGRVPKLDAEVGRDESGD